MTHIVYLILNDCNWTQNDIEKQETEPVKTSKEENIATTNYNEDSNDPDYLKKMIDENPNNPLFLKKYAQFLFQVSLQKKNYVHMRAYTHRLGIYNVRPDSTPKQIFILLNIKCTDDTKSKLWYRPTLKIVLHFHNILTE
jgi:hypothetical protein